MNNLGVLYRFEVRKIVCRKISAITMLAVILLMIAMNIGEYAAGTKIVNKEENILVGRAVDDKMLEEMRSAVAVIATMMGLWLISMLNPPYGWRLISQACSYLPVTFLGGWTFSDYRMVRLFGRLFSILETAPVVYLVLAVLLGGLTKISYERYQVTR